MIDNKTRYFIWNFYHPIQEIKALIGASTHPVFNDERYSLLKEKLGSMCSKILHLFEQPEFSSVHGIEKRNELNGLGGSFHRILSYGIKHKHGAVTNNHYSDFELNTPICIHIFPEKARYDYFYHPKLVGDDEEENSLLDDLECCLFEIIDMFGIQIDSQNRMFEVGERYDYEDEKLTIQLTDTYGIYTSDIRLQSRTHIHIFKLIDNDWVPTDHGFEFKLVPADPPLTGGIELRPNTGG